MKILCFVPFHPDYGIKPKALDSIMALEHDDILDLHFSQNDNPFDNGYVNIAYQHNKARDMVLYGHYDALLSIESDMIVPLDTIGRLIETNADVAYGLYVWRHKVRRWNAYSEIGLWGGTSVSLDYSGKTAIAAWGKIIDVDGLGLGCTLISREVLEHISFRLHDGRHSWITDEYWDDFQKLRIDPYEDRSGMMADDWLLAMDVKHAGFTQRNNLNVICGHIDGGAVLWPDPTADGFIRMEPV